ncbi:MAG: ABC transporter ATP-binding protein [Desulfomicrobium sp.]|nr:ABC transporter ATP-binding protein [Desulfomicrobium sp.]
MQIFRKILSLLTKRERLQVCLLFVAILASAFVDMLSIASIMPFMAVVTNPGVIETNAYLQWAYQYMDFANTNQFLIFIGFIVFVLIIFANSLRLGSLWYITRFVHFCKANLSRKMLHFYMMQPYHFFLSRNTSSMGKNILEEVSRVVHNVMQPILELVARGTIVFFIFAMLVAVDPALALLVFVILGGSYALIFVSVRRGLGTLGQRRATANDGRFQSASEALSGVKELKILGREKSFLDRFFLHARELAYTESSHSLITQAPKFALETIGFGGILLIVIYILSFSSQPEQIIPLLALYAFAGYRLMPSLQTVFVNLGTVRFNLASLDMLLADMGEKAMVPEPSMPAHVERLPITRDLVLDAISFSYPQTTEPVLRGLSLYIKANTTVGFVGSTGSGKTTAIDVILGLLTPQSGQLRVDGIALETDVMIRWQRNIGYVPQFIYLSDDTVGHNIAFGVPASEVDMNAVQKAARIANLHEFVVNELPQGYKTVVGERGVRLSGGQRQRIGIARALYHDPQVLVLDEATSALDNVTEEQVMEDIRNLSRQKTILMIAHRLTTVQNCDSIFMLEKGQLVASGTYADLIANSDHFQNLARRSASNGMPNEHHN